MSKITLGNPAESRNRAPQRTQHLVVGGGGDRQQQQCHEQAGSHLKGSNLVELGLHHHLKGVRKLVAGEGHGLALACYELRRPGQPRFRGIIAKCPIEASLEALPVISREGHLVTGTAIPGTGDGLMAAGQLRFQPPLPQRHDDAIHQIQLLLEIAPVQLQIPVVLGIVIRSITEIVVRLCGHGAHHHPHLAGEIEDQVVVLALVQRVQGKAQTAQGCDQEQCDHRVQLESQALHHRQQLFRSWHEWDFLGCTAVTVRSLVGSCHHS